MKARVRVFGTAAAIALAPLVYVLVHLAGLRLEPEPDPTVVVFSERSVMLGRCTVAAFVTALLAAGTIALADRYRDRAATIVTLCATVSAVAIALQSVFAP